MRLPLLLLALPLLFSLARASNTTSCPTYSEIVSIFTTCSDISDQSGCLITAGFCNATSKYATTYSSCNLTVGDIYTNCVDTLSALGTNSEAQNTADAEAICAKPFPTYYSSACDSVCPGPDDIPDLIPAARCLLSIPKNLPPDQQATYDGYACLQSQQGTYGVPTVCDSGGLLIRFAHCQETTLQAIQTIVNDTSDPNACTAILVGSLAKYCTMPFGPAIALFCTPSNQCETPFAPGINMSYCTGIAVVVGSICGFFALVLAIFLYRRYTRRAFEKKISGFQSNGSGSQMWGSPANGSGSNLMGSAGSFRGAAPSMPGSPQMMHSMPPPGMMTAYQMPTPGSTAMMMMAPGASLTAAQALDPISLARRKGELEDYYSYHSPGQPDIPGHVERLFQKYSLANIKEAVRTKYGVIPSGWETI